MVRTSGEQAMASPSQCSSCGSRAEQQQLAVVLPGLRGVEVSGELWPHSVFISKAKWTFPQVMTSGLEWKNPFSHSLSADHHKHAVDSLAHVPRLCAVERHWSPAKLCLGLYAHQLLETQGSNSVKTPAILRHDSPSSHARSPAHLCFQSPGEQILAYPSNFPLHSQGQSRHAKPRYTPETTQSLGPAFPVPRTAGIFICLCKSPQQRARSRGGTWTPLPPPSGRDPPQAPVLSSTSLCKAKRLFSQMNCPACWQRGRCFQT